MTKNSHYGVWRVSTDWTAALAVELEQLGFDGLWIGGLNDGGLHVAEELLAATRDIPVASGILNIWRADADVVARSFHRLEDRFPGRFTLGVGVGHREGVDRYTTPYTAMNEYLDVLDAHKVPADRRVLAALGDRMIKLAASRARGAHPYLTTPAHTTHARDLLGVEPLLAPEQKVVVHSDPQVARSIGRPVVDKPYLQLANYRKNLKTLGYTDADLDNGGSDRLVDDLVVHGDLAQVAARLADHHAPEADQVVIQLLSETGPAPIHSYRELAQALGITPREARPSAPEATDASR
ncbi:TIGR03620 family F420-dependent LLM class oxidoreductase [Streptomyces canus]|uniref:TIGR03620 family F420-dependent LLM class oxidoreductase n=1 Tax=Streptomyces canus TaxID=58343 RepID=UPI00369DFB7F